MKRLFFIIIMFFVLQSCCNIKPLDDIETNKDIWKGFVRELNKKMTNTVGYVSIIEKLETLENLSSDEEKNDFIATYFMGSSIEFLPKKISIKKNNDLNKILIGREIEKDGTVQYMFYGTNIWSICKLDKDKFSVETIKDGYGSMGKLYVEKSGENEYLLSNADDGIRDIMYKKNYHGYSILTPIKIKDFVFKGNNLTHFMFSNEFINGELKIIVYSHLDNIIAPYNGTVSYENNVFYVDFPDKLNYEFNSKDLL